jgi:membrane fusion protein, multidrug efflux system
VSRTALLLGLVLVSGCSRTEEASEAAAPPSAVTVGAESVVTVQREEIRTGPLISGQLSAEREATVRAQVGGSIVETRFDEGQQVRTGAVLARIEARDLREGVDSATAAVGSAENALKVAESELRRTESLVKGGALAQRDLEIARNAVANAQSQLAAARARAAGAQAQLSDTVVRSPISGVVSDKAANTGDVVVPGTALYTVIDPSSMRLEASVPSDRVGELRIGVPVHFTVRGYEGQTFAGRIERISPIADAATRQVSIFVAIPNAGGRLIAGLFAEGRVETQVRQALVVPQTAVDATGQAPAVTRIREGKAERVEVKTGLRDADTERIEIVSGLSEGDVLLIGASRGVTPGTPVSINR